MRPARFILPLMLALAPPARAADLVFTETPIGRLSLPVVENSLVLSPDSTRLAFATNAGPVTLTDKGVYQNASGTPITPTPANPNLPNNIRALIRLSIDDKSTAPFEALSQVVFSPNSKRLGFAGQKDNLWQVVIDNRTLIQDAQAVPGNPIAFSPDSAHAAWAVEKGDKFLITVDTQPWPPIDAADLSALYFSPDSQHLAVFAHIKSAWILYLDGQPLPSPQPAPKTPPARALSPQSSSLSPLTRLGEIAWWPNSAGIGFFASFPYTPWQVFSQSIEGTITYTSPPIETPLKIPPVFSPLSPQSSSLGPSSPHLAFAAEVRNKWTLYTETTASPAPPFDNLMPASLCFVLPTPSPTAGTTGIPQLLYLAQQNKQWHLYVNHQPLPGLSLDNFLPGSFRISPDHQHYAFAATRSGKTLLIKDGQTVLIADEAAPQTLAFSPDSQHFAAATRTGPRWVATLDGKIGKATFAGFAPEPIAFSPDSTRIAYSAEFPDKTWRILIGPDAEIQSKPYERLLKDSRVTWHEDNTITAIAILKTIATRLEGTVPK